MDAREILRRYLEQRRELGEHELVLDGMQVDEVLRIVGALRTGGSAAKGGSAEPERRERSERPVRPERARPGDQPRPDGADAGPAGPGGADFDWRATLRAAGGAPMSPSQRPMPPHDERSAPDERSATEEHQPRAASGTAGAGADADQSQGEEMAARKTTRAPREKSATSPATAGDRASTPTKPERATNESADSVLPSWLKGFDAPLGLVVGGRTTELLAEEFTRLRTIEEVARAVDRCMRCPLYKTATHGVPGEGNPDADLICVGEAPGAHEDETGRPFVGASGQLLTKILSAISLSREEVFICNVLKHRPPANRNPAPDEVEACSPYLLRQLELVKPRVIVTFGTFAAQTLLQTRTPIGKLREQVHLYHGIPLVVTYHPAALLRNQAWKRPTWNDVKLARRILDRATGA